MERASWEQIAIFSHMSREERELFEQSGRLCDYQDGAFIFREGDAAHSFWVIVSGAVEVIKNWGSGEEKQLQIMQPGDFMGELGVVHPNHLRTASARASGPAQLLEIPLADLESLLNRQSNLALPILREAIARFLKTENAAIQELVDKNRRLAQSLAELEAAQAQLIEQEKLEHELGMARQIQEAFLPRQTLALPGWEMCVHWKPARTVSGDFYDFMTLPCGRTAIVVGDVAGKGMPAALVMAVTRSIIRATLRSGGKPGDLLAQINTLLVNEMPPAMYVTAFLGVLDAERGEIEFANAGHCLPVRCSAGESVELRARGMPLGLMPDMEYEEGRAAIAPGEWVLFYSDALTEAHDPAGQMFGMERLHRAVQRAASQASAATGLIANIIDCQIEFSGSQAEPEDDLTLIALYRKPT